MRTSSAILFGWIRRLERLLLGREKSPLERDIFHSVSLVAFFAWVGLGADGLSSSCYGPEEAYLALHGQHYLALFLALATAVTVGVIAGSYTQIIELFPGGGGGYVVANRLLNPTAGVISGCALVVDYVLTIAVSVASGVDALLSFTAHADSPYKTGICLLAILGLVTINLRGVKESVRILLPIFLLFLITHVILLGVTFGEHFDGIPVVVRDSWAGTRESIATTGFWATAFLFLRAYSMGAGTYTGIEAVSNGMAVLREPRIRTGRRTMFYMAVSLAITAAGILIGYRLFDIQHEAGRTLNATLVHDIADGWNRGGLPWGTIFVALTLLAEGSLLFVAAQTGFLGGPRMLASMAVDRWVPNRFANLSSRLVTGNGVLLMGVAAAVALLYTQSSVKHLVIMYSINVFVTFTLSQLGMVRHWWMERGRAAGWLWRLLLNGSGLLISFSILVVTVSLKFFQGGWVTVLVTGSTVGMAFLVRRHYRRFQFALTMLNLLVENTLGGEPKADAGQSAAIFVNRYDGLGLHTLGRVRSLMGQDLRKVVFLSVVQVDSDQFRDEAHIESLRHARAAELQRYEAVARSAGLETESAYALGTDVVEELELLAVGLASRAPSTVFVAGQVVFQQETLTMRLLHNEVAFALQRRLLYRGLDIIIVPVQLPAEIW
jgi:amino acid transporter